jgi:hypothetical protein
MSYRILESVHRPMLEEYVKDLMLKGWQPLGSIAIAILPTGREWPPIYTVHYAQAMIQKEN